MKKTLITAVALLGALVFAPAAQANEPPYPPCDSRFVSIRWVLGSWLTEPANGGVFAGRTYVVSHSSIDDASQAWKKDATGTWVQTPLYFRDVPEEGVTKTFASFKPVLGSQTITMGFSFDSGCMATDSIQVDGRVPFATFRAEFTDPYGFGPRLKIWGYPRGYDCHALPPGQFAWKIYVSGKLSKVLRYIDACGALSESGWPLNGNRWRGKYINAYTGTKTDTPDVPSVSNIEIETRQIKKTVVRKLKVEATVNGHRVFSRKYTSYNRYYRSRVITENNVDYIKICINGGNFIQTKNGVRYCKLSARWKTSIKTGYRKGAK